MCSGLKYIHQKSVLRRDLKSSNVLLQMADGQPLAALIADFGEARLAVGSPLTPDVVTIWYRAPEILVSHDRYGSPVDVWSLGCIIVEMEHGMPLFVAASEVGMLFANFYICGTPSSGQWQSLHASSKPLQGLLGGPLVGSFKEQFPKPWGDTHMRCFVSSLLQLAPEKRPSAATALLHRWLD